MGQTNQAEQVGQDSTLADPNAQNSAWGTNTACADDPSVSLQTVTAGILNDDSPLQFMDRINAESRRLGNRAFMQYVAELTKRGPTSDPREIAARGLRGTGQTLTHLATLQRAFGHHDVRGMREHTDSAAVSALESLGAEGYTSSGRMALSGSPDLYVQAHEAAHGVQQAALGDRMQLPGGTGQAGDRYEQQADAVADAVVRGRSAQPILDEMVGYSTQVTPGAVIAVAPVQMKWPDKNLENLTMEEFEAAIQEMTDEELDEAWEELTLLLEIAELEEKEVKSKSQASVKKEKKGKLKPSQEEIEAMRAAKKAQTRGTKVAGGKKQKSTSHAMTTAGFPFGVAEVSPQSETRLKQQKHKQQQKAPTKKGVTKKGGVLTLEDIQGLNDMFLARALNHLIMGELYELDPMIGDEGCQMRTPFVLDMCRLVQEKMPVNAVELVNEYRARTDGEQNGVFRRLRKLEKDRRDKDEMYATNVSEFISSNPLNESISAKSGEYEAMFANLTAAINDYEPECSDYLARVCSEGAIYWRDVLDPFGISMLTDRRSIFSESILSRRKVRISMHSKKYMARSAARLVEIGGGSVISEERELGYEKKRGMQKNPQFLVARTNKEDILSMLLHAVQMHSGAGSVKGGRLEMGPCWETVRLALTYTLKQGYPLLVNLRRVVVSGAQSKRKYSTNISRTLFYEPGAEGFKYLPSPSAQQQSQGALLFLGYSMLKKGDTEMSRAVLPVAPWVFEQDPQKFIAGFTKCDISNVLLLGGAGTHPPLNTFAPGSNAYGLPGGPECEYRFADDPGGVKYSEAIHDRVLADLGQSEMTEYGRQFLIPKSEIELQEEYEEYLRNKETMQASGMEAEPYVRTLFKLTDKAKKLVFPDQCPINIAGIGAKFNIKEEYQLLKLLSVAAGMKNVLYSKENKKEETAERVAAFTIPFSIVHILASNYAHEYALSREYADLKTRGIIETLVELRKQ